MTQSGFYFFLILLIYEAFLTIRFSINIKGRHIDWIFTLHTHTLEIFLKKQAILGASHGFTEVLSVIPINTNVNSLIVIFLFICFYTYSNTYTRTKYMHTK